MKIEKLRTGSLVKAIRLLDEGVAHVVPGTLGVVFQETNFYGDEGGPIVRWTSGNVCNVYEGDVEVPVQAGGDCFNE